MPRNGIQGLAGAAGDLPLAAASARPTTASIIISNYNYERYVSAAIDSALTQTFPHCEVIVVDDGSTDGSRAVIERYRADPRVKIIHQANSGQAQAINAGFAASSGDVIIFLDADDMLLPRAVETVLTHWESGLSRCQYALEVIDSSGTVIGLHPFSQRMEDGDLLWELIVGGYFWYVPTSGNAFAREILRHILPMAPEAWRICADTYIVAMSAAYGPIRNLYEPLARYRVHSDNHWYQDTMNEARLHEILGNRLRVWCATADLMRLCPMGAESPRQAAAIRDYAALYLYRRVLAANAAERPPLDPAVLRAAYRAAVWRSLSAGIPFRHRLLYLAYLATIGPRGWRLPAADRWNAHHSLRPRWLSRAISALKGRTYYDWMAQRPRPGTMAEFVLDRPIEFGAQRQAARHLWYGWDRSEPFVNWAFGREAALIGRLPLEHHDLDIAIDLTPYLGGILASQRLIVRANGSLVFEKAIAGDETVRFTVPRALARKQDDFVLAFTFPDAAAPRYLTGATFDFRPLGFAFRSLTISNMAIGRGLLSGPHAPLDRRIAVADESGAGYLGEGWHAPSNGAVHMARREAFLKMTLLNGAAFDHVINLEFVAEDRDLVEHSEIGIRFNGKRSFSLDLVKDREASVLVPKATIGEDGGLTIRLIAGNLLPGRAEGAEPGLGAVGPGLRAFSIERISLPARRPMFIAGKTLSFRAGGTARPFMVGGWRAPDAQGTMTSDVTAELSGLFARRDREIFLTTVVYPPIDKAPFAGQTLRIVCNGCRVAEYSIDARAEVTAILPAGLIGDDHLLRVEYQVSMVARPSDVGAGNDHRPLGIGVEALLLE